MNCGNSDVTTEFGYFTEMVVAIVQMPLLGDQHYLSALGNMGTLSG